MKLITFDQIQELEIDVKQCYQWVADMIKNKSDTMLPPKISMKPSPEIFINFMPSFVNRQVGGIKIVSRYPERTPSLDSKLILLDITSGEYLAIMDADWITTMRTGAVAVHSIKHRPVCPHTMAVCFGIPKSGSLFWYSELRAEPYR